MLEMEKEGNGTAAAVNADRSNALRQNIRAARVAVAAE
jgi:hypothetical protein